jgi:hypothetical protein
MVVRDPVAHFDAILSSCGGGGGGGHVRAAAVTATAPTT